MRWAIDPFRARSGQFVTVVLQPIENVGALSEGGQITACSPDSRGFSARWNAHRPPTQPTAGEPHDFFNRLTRPYRDTSITGPRPWLESVGDVGREVPRIVGGGTGSIGPFRAVHPSVAVGRVCAMHRGPGRRRGSRPPSAAAALGLAGLRRFHGLRRGQAGLAQRPRRGRRRRLRVGSMGGRAVGHRGGPPEWRAARSGITAGLMRQ